MKIELELPDWVETQRISILAGKELVASKVPDSKWKIKTERCNHCGECCLDAGDRRLPWGLDDEGKCNALIKEGNKWLCGAGLYMPYICLHDPSKKNFPSCNIEHKEI